MTRRQVLELPYAGINRIRFQGYVSARTGTPSWTDTVTNGPSVCKMHLPARLINHMF